jgi:chromosome segregation ATPase
MADNSDALKASRRQDSRTKRRRASEALEVMIEAGEPITFPAVARRAGVSVSLLYADSELAARIVEARSRQRDAGLERVWRLPTRSLVSEQSLRADLANANDRARRLSEELSVLREQLERQLGAESDVASGRTSSPRLEQLEERAAELQAANVRSSDQVAELESALREANETLDAARAMNRELIAEINRPQRLDSTSTEPSTLSPTAGHRGLANP